MNHALEGIHHISAITGSAQRNADFYSGVLGLRLVKRTVNFDDPGSYHLYYGNELGEPGTLLTFFAWPGATRGHLGTGEPSAVALLVPASSLAFWRARLERAAVTNLEMITRFGEEGLAFSDPDGMRVELVARADAAGLEPWTRGAIAAEHAVRGLDGLTLLTRRADRTLELLTNTMGFESVGVESGRTRLRSGTGPAASVDVIEAPGQPGGVMGAGTIHHVAWRAHDDAAQLEWLGNVAQTGLSVTDVQERCYFRSIYFRERGGVLFEIATDGPGFGIDESAAELGTTLRLPPWLESQRARLEAHLPPLIVRGDTPDPVAG
jgi:glyoxalase family protein